MSKKRFFLFLLSFFPLLGMAAFTADLSNGQVKIQVQAEPDRVSPARDLMVTFSVESPASVQVTFPDLQDRFSGFSLAEDFAEPSVTANGRTRRLFRWRLEPKPAAERYRLAPFAVSVVDSSAQSQKEDSFVTKPILFPKDPPPAVVTGDPEVTFEPIYIPPTARTVTFWSLLALVGIGLVVLFVWAARHITRRVKEMRLSPADRAMVELKRLLARDLPGRGLFKEFYIELTHVVRRYIERRHGIRAPEQTTEEFLAAAARHKAFSPESISSLRTFLESADLVKFAGQKASGEMADEATRRAQKYLADDAAVMESNEQEAGQ